MKVFCEKTSILEKTKKERAKIRPKKLIYISLVNCSRMVESSQMNELLPISGRQLVKKIFSFVREIFRTVLNYRKIEKKILR